MSGAAVQRLALPPAAAPGFCMHAASPQGAVRLLLAQQTRSAAEAAIALHRSAAWLDLLEDWLAPATGALHWAPADLPDGHLPAEALVSSDDGAAPHRLALPWPLLAHLPAPPPALGLAWPGLAAELLLGSQALPPEDLGRLAVGSALLVEASFEAARPPRVLRAGRADPQASMQARLELRQPLHGALAAECLAGWRLLPEPLPLQPRVTLHWAGPQPCRPLAEGRLMPWGRGQALRIEALLDRELALRLQAERAAWT